MVMGKYQRSFVGSFEVKVHILLNKTLAFEGNAVVEHNLIF